MTAKGGVFFMETALVVLVIFLLLFFLPFQRQRRQSKRFRSIDARVVRIERREPRISEDTVGEPEYHMTVTFFWEGQYLQRVWGPVKGKQIPRVGETIRLSYDPKADQLGHRPLNPRLRRKIWLFGAGSIAVLAVLSALLQRIVPSFDDTNIPAAWILFFIGGVFLIIDLTFWHSRRVLQRKIASETLRPVPAIFRGYRQRQDSDGDPLDYPLYEVTFGGVTRQVEGNVTGRRPYTVGQTVTLYRDPETGKITEAPGRTEAILGVVFLLPVCLCCGGGILMLLLNRL